MTQYTKARSERNKLNEISIVLPLDDPPSVDGVLFDPAPPAIHQNYVN